MKKLLLIAALAAAAYFLVPHSATHDSSDAAGKPGASLVADESSDATLKHAFETHSSNQQLAGKGRW